MGVLTLEEKIEKFLTLGDGNGYGDGDGYGHGNGYGDGYGDGDGDGHGNGYGDGYGDGYGYGNGYGDGYGDGYGYGDGDGHGNGYGDGYGNGYGMIEFQGHKLYTIDDISTAITAVHGSDAEGFTIRHNSEMVPCYIARVGDYFAHGETLKDARRDAQQKFDDSLPTEEKIQRFIDFCKGKDTIPAADLFQWHHTLTGSCEMGRREFCKVHHIDIDNDHFTVAEFINLTINSYRGDIIKQLKNFIMRTDN